MIDEARWPMTTPDPSTRLKKRTREQEEDTVSLGDEPLDWGDSADDVCDLLANNLYGGSPSRDLYVTCSFTLGKANPSACAVIAPCISEGDC